MGILRKGFINPITISYYLENIRDNIVASNGLNYDTYTEDEGRDIIQKILRGEEIVGCDIILADMDNKYEIVDGYKRFRAIENFADGKLSCGTLFKMEDFLNFKLNILVVGEDGVYRAKSSE